MPGTLGIGAIIGSAAGGFEQARQQDLQRQFADEQNRRAMAGDLLQKIALDPNHPQEVRVAAGKTYLGLSQMPGNKTFDFGKQLGPVFDLMAKYQGAARQAQQQPGGPPPPPPGIQGLAGIGGPTPAQANQLPIAAGAPSAPGGVGPTQASAITLPPPPAPPAGMPIAQAGPPPAQAVPPQPPAGEFLAGPQTIAQNAQTMARAQSSGTEMGNLQVRKQIADQLMNDPKYAEAIKNDPMLSGLLVSAQLGVTMPYGMMRMGMSGEQKQMTFEQAQANPQIAALIPPGTKPNDLLSVTYTQGGTPQFVTAVTPNGLLSSEHKGFIQTTDAAGNTRLVPITTQTQKKIPQSPSANPTGGTNPPAPPSTGSVIGHKPVPPELQDKIQEQARMRNSAIGLIDDITRNKSVLDSLIGSGKIAIAANPDGTGVLSRAEGLTDKEAKVASDFQQLIEHANLLRGPLGATGFRGQEAWNALQAQRGKPMADPRITAQVMQGMRSRLMALNSADQKILSGTGGDTSALEPMVGGHKVGDTIQLANGQSVKLTKIHDDGTFDADPVTQKK